MLADINVIDHANLTLHKPHMIHDLPAGGRRLVQDADGYLATVKAGEIVVEHDEVTNSPRSHAEGHRHRGEADLTVGWRIRPTGCSPGAQTPPDETGGVRQCLGRNAGHCAGWQ